MQGLRCSGDRWLHFLGQPEGDDLCHRVHAPREHKVWNRTWGSSGDAVASLGPEHASCRPSRASAPRTSGAQDVETRSSGLRHGPHVAAQMQLHTYITLHYIHAYITYLFVFVYIYIFMCMYIYMYLYIHMYIYICISIRQSRTNATAVHMVSCCAQR